LPVPEFVHAGISDDAHQLARSVTFPVVVKPLMLSGSRGVMRADAPGELVAAFYRLRALLQAPDIRAERSEADAQVLVEGFIEGREFAVEGVLDHGMLQLLAIFDKPDPLNGPFFEETIYVTPSCIPPEEQAAIAGNVARAAQALGLRHGPIHAECRMQSRAGNLRVFVLEVAARPIGGLCARALRFQSKEEPGPLISLEELLLRHALGESAWKWQREAAASGVMMIPIPRRGYLRGVSGVETAEAVAHIEDVRITAKQDQLLVPLPEGASYLGFIFARASDAVGVERALREAHARLVFTIDPELPMLASAQTRYNSPHG
jgi:biotin carboxylase